MSNIKQLKKPIRAFMREHYTDERLAQLLAHAQSGKLAFYSCCCFIGCANAPHALMGKAANEDQIEVHISRARILSGGREAEDAYEKIVEFHPFDENHDGDKDEKGRRILIPMIRAEMKRRDRQALSKVSALEATVSR